MSQKILIKTDQAYLENQTLQYYYYQRIITFLNPYNIIKGYLTYLIYINLLLLLKKTDLIYLGLLSYLQAVEVLLCIIKSYLTCLIYANLLLLLKRTDLIYLGPLLHLQIVEVLLYINYYCLVSCLCVLKGHNYKLQPKPPQFAPYVHYNAILTIPSLCSLVCVLFLQLSAFLSPLISLPTYPAQYCVQLP